MEGQRDAVECRVYEKGENRVTAFGCRRKSRGWIVVLLVAVLLAVVFVFGVGETELFGEGVANWLAELSVSRGFLFFRGNEDLPPVGDITGSEESTGTETEGDSNEESGTAESDNREDGETSEILSDTEGTEDSETETESGRTDSADTVTLDLSEAERGDCYIINDTSTEPDAQALLEAGFRGAEAYYSQAPVVMVLHTHTSETYCDAAPADRAASVTKSVIAVGECIVSELNTRGVPTVHCTVIHDGESNRSSYENAADTIETMLRIYPSVRYVIDVHRLAESDGEGRAVKTLTPMLDGVAQIRVTVSNGGSSSQDNLTLALCLRRELNAYGDRLCMPTVLTESEFNSELSLYYLKVDVGGLGNTTEEAVRAGEYFAKALVELLKK